MKYKSTRQNLHNHLHGVDSTEYVPGKKKNVSPALVSAPYKNGFVFEKIKAIKHQKTRPLSYTIQRCPIRYTEEEEEEEKEEDDDEDDDDDDDDDDD